MYKETITPEEINEMPPAAFGGDVIIIDDANQEEAVAYLSSQAYIGFDTESRAVFKKGVKNHISLLQLSGPDRAYLFRLNKTKLSKGVLNILRSEKICKIGVAIHDDILQMQEVTRFRAGGFVDLQTIIRQYGVNELSLKKMAAIVLGVRVSKAQRLSNWNAQTLTEAQARYAAIDAWICREMYLKLLKSPKNPLPKPTKNESKKNNPETP